MFKLNQSDTYFFPVTVELPIDGGKFDKVKFDAEFKRLPRAQIKDIMSRVGTTAPDGSKIEDPINDDGVLDRVFVGWKGIVDEKGDVVEYSQTAREAVLEIHGVAAGIVRAWFDSLSGSKTKN
jgi:hypothetical protein